MSIRLPVVPRKNVKINTDDRYRLIEIVIFFEFLICENIGRPFETAFWVGFNEKTKRKMYFIGGQLRFTHILDTHAAVFRDKLSKIRVTRIQLLARSHSCKTIIS